MTEEKLSKVQYVAHSMFIALAAIVAVYFASNLVMTIIFAAFIALALEPWCEKLEDKGMNRTISVLLIVVGIASFLSLLLGMLILQTKAFIGGMPDLSGSFTVKLNEFSNHIMDFMGMESQKKIWSPKKLLSHSGDAAGYAVSTISTVIFFIVSVPVYVFFMLQYRDNFTAFLKIGADNSSGIDKRMALLNKIKSAVRAYIKGMGIVLVVVAILSCIAYLALGLPYAIFLGLCSAILTLIPYIGVYMSAIIPAFVALATKDSVWYPIGVLLSVMLIQFLEGNIITPKIVGNQVDLNPLVVVLSIVVIGFIGGILGMILAVPIVAIIKIILDNNPDTKHYGLLLSTSVDLRDKSIASNTQK